MEEEEVPSYNVFINHGEPDTKRTLAALICRDLKAEGVKVFVDENEFQGGERNEDEIKKAIASSYVYIAIFSPRYAESTWCLEELCWMFERRPESKLIPIFYNVEPSDVRYIENGTYANAFRDHSEKDGVDDQVLDKWKGALRNASGISGLTFDPEAGPRNIVQIADEIVKLVLEEVWKNESLELAKHVRGLQQATEEFQKEISNQYKRNGIITVGIVGAGGSGKSTLVKHFCNMEHIKFERSYLLSVACEEECSPSQHKPLSCGSSSIEEDPLSLLRRLQSRSHLRIEVPSNETSLLRRLRDHLQGIPKVLIILDELYNSKQIKNLLLLKGKLGDGSMVVVTSRDRDLLRRSQVNIIYEIKPLDDANARYLFCQHAFREPIPLRGFEDSVQDVLRICEGLPLALKVLGGYFYGVKDQSSWDEKRKELDRQLPDGIKKILNPSYMSLDSAEKEVLLDVAHFLEGEDIELVERVLEGLDSSGIDCLYSLEQKGLVEFENVAVNFYDESKHGKCPQSEDFYTVQSRRPKRRLKMKRLVRDLVREKAMEEFKSQPQPQVKPLRLSGEVDRKIQLQLQHFFNVRGIRISKCFQMVAQFLSGLKFLVHEDFTHPFNASSGDLVWLRLHNLSGHQFVRVRSLENLRVMELKGVIHLENLKITSDIEPPLELRELTVDVQEISRESASSSSSIFRLGGLFGENLTVPFLLERCRLFSGEMKNLVKLVWKNVKGLKILPFKLEVLRELTHLDLSGWSDLMASLDFTSLSNLQYLALQDCSNLTTIELGGIYTIKCLDFEGCGKLKSLNVQGLKSIEEINFAGCWKLQSIEGFGQLQALSYFNISSVSKLNNILPFPSNVSTAILSVAASPSALDLVKDEVVKTFQHVTFYDISPTVEQASPLSVQLRNTSSNRVIVVCLIGESSSDFHIKFGWEDGYSKPFGAKGPQETLGSEHYTEETHMMHIFMWTEDSEEFKDLKFGGKEVISCTVQAVNPLRGPEKSSVEKGAIMMSTNKCDSVELLQFLFNCKSSI